MKREPNMEDAPYRVFKSEKQVNNKKKKRKETFQQLDIFGQDNDGPV